MGLRLAFWAVAQTAPPYKSGMHQFQSFIAMLGGLLYYERIESPPSEKVNSFGQSLVLLATELGGRITLQVAPGQLVLNEVPVPIRSPGANEVSEYLLQHQIQGVRFPPDPSALDFQRFGAVFARQSGSYDDIAQVCTALGSRFAGEGQVDGAPSMLSLIRPASEAGWHTFNSVPVNVSTSEPDPPRDSRGDRVIEELTTFDGAVPRLTDLHYASRTAEAERAGDGGALLDVLLDVMNAESHAHTEAEGAGVRALLERILTPPRLRLLARQAGQGSRREEATGVLRKLGPDATDALMRELVEAPTLGERQGYFRALTHMTDGTDIVIRHIGHEQWFVVRNAAALAGEMDLQRAVPALAARADHRDERVRRSVAQALATICTPEALPSLRRLMDDESARVRLAAIAFLDPRRSRPLGWPLARQLEVEPSVDIQHAIVRLLGRLGTAEARGGLERFIEARPASPAADAARAELGRPGSVPT